MVAALLCQAWWDGAPQCAAARGNAGLPAGSRRGGRRARYHGHPDRARSRARAGASAPPSSKRRTIRSRRGVRPNPERRPSCTRRSEEHTSELQSLMRISYAVFCLKKKKINKKRTTSTRTKIINEPKRTKKERTESHSQHEKKAK